MKVYKIRNKTTGKYLQSLKWTRDAVKINWTKTGRTMIDKYSFDQTLRNVLRKHSLKELTDCELVEFEVSESKTMPVLAGIKGKYFGDAVANVDARDLVKLKKDNAFERDE